MTMTYKPEHYIKGLNIHSVRDLFLPAKVSATLDLMMPDVSKKSNFYKKAFLLLAFLEAAEGFTYTFDAHFAEHTRHCAMPLYIMEIETIACKWPTAPKMLRTLRNFKADFFKIIRKGEMKKLRSKTPDAVHDEATLQELQKLKSEFVREFSGFLSYLGHRGPCYADTCPAEKKRNDPKAGVIRLFFPEQEKAYHHLFTEFQFFDEATVGMSWFNRH